MSADSSEDDGEGSEDSLDDDDFEDEDGDGLMDEEDFGEANIVDRFKQDWKKTPIITKTFFRVNLALVHMIALVVLLTVQPCAECIGNYHNKFPDERLGIFNPSAVCGSLFSLFR